MEKKVFKIDELAIELAEGRCEKHLEAIQDCLNGFKALNMGNLTDKVFAAVVAGNPEALRPAWDKKIDDEVADITTNPAIAKRLRVDADQPFDEWADTVKQAFEERNAPGRAGEALAHFFSFEKGRAAINHQAIKEHYTSYWSEDGLHLLSLAEQAKKVLDEITAFMKEKGVNLLKQPVLPGDRPFMVMGYTMPGYDPILRQREGNIVINEEEIANHF
ncbi:MAG TPA: hypothetical protein DDW62_08730 [Marinilabiliaceae bacterium]|nr:hypothetical protein [Marinilabiliaceae bacterium]